MKKCAKRYIHLSEGNLSTEQKQYIRSHSQPKLHNFVLRSIPMQNLTLLGHCLTARSASSLAAYLTIKSQLSQNLSH